MKAAVYTENGPPTVLKYEDVPDPVCDENSVLIKVGAVSIEGGDTLNRLGGDLVTKPHIVGYQAAGEVIEVGKNVTDHKVGDRVTTVNAFGSHAELRAVLGLTAFPIPGNLSLEEAAAVPVPFATAHDCLFEFGHLQKGETVLVQAGAGAVGLAAIQLAKRAGATVLATASSDERLARLKDYGMDHGINYKTQDLVAEVKRLTGDQGVNLVVDPVGGSTLQKSLDSLAYRGRVSMVGRAGREPMTIDPTTMMGGNQSLTGVFLGAEIATDRVQKNLRQLLADIAKGELKVVLDKKFPLSQAAQAHAYIESRQAFGRVLLIP